MNTNGKVIKQPVMATVLSTMAMNAVVLRLCCLGFSILSFKV